MIVAGVDISRTYSVEEIMSMYHKGLLKPIALKGYVTRADANGQIGFVPWHESTLARSEAGKKAAVTFDVDEMREGVEAEHPITRRTPQERVAAVALRILAEVKRSGGHGLTPQEVNQIVGETWAVGDPVTGEQVRALAAHFLGVGEKTNKEADSHRVTRAHATS